jgi:hypothetical protein
MPMFIVATYQMPSRLSPTLCEAAQRDLDTIDPQILLHVEGMRADILAPSAAEWRVSAVMYALIEAAKCPRDQLGEYNRRRLGMFDPLSLHWPVERLASESLGADIEQLIAEGLMYIEDASHGWRRIGLTSAGREEVARRKEGARRNASQGM